MCALGFLSFCPQQGVANAFPAGDMQNKSGELADGRLFQNIGEDFMEIVLKEAS